jgi:hypothetical protein
VYWSDPFLWLRLAGEWVKQEGLGVGCVAERGALALLGGKVEQPVQAARHGVEAARDARQ